MVKYIPSRLIYAAQIRAARGLLNWSQGELAERAGVSKQSVTRIEAGTMDPRFSTMTALNEAIQLHIVQILYTRPVLTGRAPFNAIS
jgi:predicted transcriptional regulator